MTVEGKLYDGVQSTSTSVSLSIHGDTLILTSPFPFQALASWPIKTLLSKNYYPGQPIILSSPSDPSARLHLEQHHFQSLSQLIPSLKLNKHQIPLTKICLTLLFMLAILTFSISYWGTHKLVAPIANIIPQSWENKLGNYVLETFTSKYKRVLDPEALASLNKIHKHLQNTNPKIPNIEIILLNSETINAFACPGNKVILFTGLIDFTESPEELAGIIAHECGHISHNHITKSLVRILGVSALSGILFGDLDIGTHFGNFLTLKHSREAETEADLFARDTLTAANASTDGLKSFFTRLEDDDSEFLSAYFSSHPPLESRIESIQSNNNPSSPTPVLPDEEWYDLKDIAFALLSLLES